MKPIKTLFFFSLLLLAQMLSAQETKPQLIPNARFEDQKNADQPSTKSVEAINAYSYISSYSVDRGRYSDYYIYYRWYDYYTSCDCSNGYFSVTLTINGTGYYAGAANGVNNVGDACKLAVGPGKSGWASARSNEGGKDDYFLFGCVSGCGHYYYTTSDISYTTQGIYRPKSVTASQGTWDFKIKLNITPDTDIPSNLHGYYVTRTDGKFRKYFPYGVTSMEDSTCKANKTYTYNIQTYTTSFGDTARSSVYQVTGTTFNLNLQASQNERAAVKLNWEDIRGKGKATLQEYVVNRVDTLKKELITLNNYLSPTTLNTVDQSNLLIPGFQYMYVLVPQPASGFFPDTAWGRPLPNGSIKGKVISPSGYPVENVRVCAVRKTYVPQDTTTTYCAITDSSGVYEIPRIYYYENAQFTIIPFKEDHGFDPASASVVLNSDYPMVQQAPFRDTSAFRITGSVIQIFEDDTLPVSNVEIYLDNKSEPETKTDATGKYQLNVGQMGNYTLRARLEMHGFANDSMRYYVKSDTAVRCFVDTTRFTLSGYLKGACDTYIGRARLEVMGGDITPCIFHREVTTDTLTGYYEMLLPARDYKVFTAAFYPEHDSASNGDVLAYFDTVPSDLTLGNQTLDFIYRSAPRLNVSGFTDMGCGEYAGVPIIEQGYKYTIGLDLLDAFAGNTCPAQSGMVVIKNRLGKEDLQIDTLYCSGETLSYFFVPGNPNLIANYLKNISFITTLGKEIVEKPIDVLVQGNFAREKTFTTVSPEIPFMILRDPPGDASYSYLEKGTTSETALRFSSAVEGSLNLWSEVKLGTKFELGLFGNSVETEIWGKVKGSLEVGAAIRGQSEYQLSITNSEAFRTSDNSDITGESGDLYAGSALNMIYALTDIVKYDQATCAVKKSVGLCVGVDNFATTFMYTEDHIRNTLIPGLVFLKNYYAGRGNDSAGIYANQIKVWEQTLALNKRLKDRSTYINNISFSSGAIYENSQEVSVTESGSLEFNMYIASSIAAEAGIEIAGSGVSGGVEAKFRVDMGSGISSTNISTKKTGFYLSDDDLGDDFTVDICSDKVFGTPVFKIVSGQSSCPWEPGTLPREGVQLTADSYNQYVDSPDGLALFHLQLGNVSQSDENRVYNLVFDQSSNPDGAIITLGGSQVQGGIPTPYSIAAGSSKQATVTVEKGPEAFDYENLQFTMYSMCGDGQISDTVLLSAHFKNSCSNIQLSEPGSGWILSGSSNNTIKIRLRGYDKALLDFVKIQLALKGTNNWQNIDYLAKADLDDGITEKNLVLDQFPDGPYELRALLQCSGGKVYSDITPGLIDRTPPQLYGIPEPADFSLDSADQIMAIFDEPVNCYKLSSANVTLSDLTTGEAIPAILGCSNNIILVVPDLEGKNLTGDTLNVQLSGIEDLFGNATSAPIGWSFVVRNNPAVNPDEDSDQDGIPNSSDNCPYSYNPDQADMDLDGLGDICDPDVDGDGILNGTDNCMLTYNPDQADSDHNGIGDVCDKSTGLTNPDELTGLVVHGNYPNPFGQKTSIRYSIAVRATVTISIYDILGNEVKVITQADQQPGDYEPDWDASGLSEGVYLAKFRVESAGTKAVSFKTIKMVLSK